MKATYLGPADVFIVDGKEVRRGGSVNMTKEALLAHSRHGHRFDVEGLDQLKPAPWDTAKSVNADDQRAVPVDEIDPRAVQGGMGNITVAAPVVADAKPSGKPPEGAPAT